MTSLPPPLPATPEFIRLYYLGFDEQALEIAKKAVEEHKDDLDNRVYMVWILSYLKDFQMAKIWINQLVAKDPQGTRHHTAMGLLIEREKRDLDQAWYEYQAGINADPGFFLNYARCAWICKERKDNEQALRYYNQAISQSPNHYILIANRGALLATMGKFIEAEQDGLRSIQIKDDFPYSYEAIIRSHIGQKKESQATLDYVEKLDNLVSTLEKRGSKEFSNWRAWILEKKKQLNLTLHRLEEGLRQQVLYYEIKQFEDDSADYIEPEWQMYHRTCNQHFLTQIQPRIASANEKFLGIWYPFFSYGFHTNTSWGDGNSYYHHEGTYGAGYVCITDRNIYINNFGALAKEFLKGKNVGLFVLAMALRNFDNTKRELKDKSWVFPVTAVTSVMTKEKQIHVIFGRDEWTFSESDDEREMLYTALSLCQSGRIGDLWKKSERQLPATANPADILAAVEKLSELHAKGILSDQEFEKKKAVLLDQIQ